MLHFPRLNLVGGVIAVITVIWIYQNAHSRIFALEAVRSLSGFTRRCAAHLEDASDREIVRLEVSVVQMEK